VGYRLVTDDYFLLRELSGSENIRRFQSLAGLHRFLADSSSYPVTACDRLDSLKRYVLRIEVTSISLSDLNLFAVDSTASEGGSPIKFLFGQFLRLTGFGREKLSVRTRPFSIAELVVKE